jgi:hypothetical protein
MKMRAPARLLAILMLLSACGSDESEEAAVAEVSVDLFLDSSGVRITKVYPAAEFPIAKFQNYQQSLHYELIDPTGYRVVAGKVPDWRMAYTESLPDGSMSYDPQRQSFGAGSIRLPMTPGTLVVREWASGTELGRVDFDPVGSQVGSIHRGLASDDDILGPAVQFEGDNDTEAAVDLLFLGDGFTEDQLAEYEETAHNYYNAFIALHYYNVFGARFNAWTQRVRSTEEGIDDPDNGVMKDTAFDFGMGEGDGRRCVFFKTNEGLELARRLGTEAHADVVIIIANTTEYGGCATSGVFSVTRDASAPEIISHELGHALFGLADEYDYGGTPPCAHDSDAPNVTNHGTRDTVPWSDIVTATEFPTPAGSAGVGAFEGAGYCPMGMYRPEDNCLMRALGVPFCAVCAREVNRYFENFGEPQGPQNDCPPEWYDDGICDLCLGNDPDCAAEVCDYDSSCDVEDGEDCGDCEADCGSCGHSENDCSWWDLVVCQVVGDCGERCPQSSDACGDGVCDGAETDGNCGQDCGCASLGQCNDVAPIGCWCDTHCEEYGDCCSDIEVCGF